MRAYDGSDPPSPQQLAAYADGELDPVSRVKVAEWLARHPEAAAEIDAHVGFQRTAQSAPPPEPGEAAWSSVLKRIDERTQTIRAGKKQNAVLLAQRRAWLLRRMRDVSVAAAAVLLVFLWGRYHIPDQAPRFDPLNTAPQAARALPVVSDQDVEIISMEAGDLRCLVVGEPPLHRAIVLATMTDVLIEKVEQDTDGMMPKNMNEPTPWAPMIVVPLQVARDR
jgi:anti-sigma factor RsiW